MTQKGNLRSIFPLFIAISLLTFSKSGVAAPNDTEQPTALAWPTSGKIAALDLFKQHGVKSGSVEQSSEPPVAYQNWGKSSTVSWAVDIQLAGQYQPTINYQSGEEVAYVLEVDGKRYEGTLQPSSEPKKLNLPVVTMERVGINRVSLSISSSNQDNSFKLDSFKAKHIPGVVTISKPVLIAGSDWLKIQASLKINNEDQKLGSLRIQGSIKPWPDGEVLWEGPVAATAVDGGFEIDNTIRDLAPKLWTPESPTLYLVTLSIEAGEQTERILQAQGRIGFRQFEAKDGRFTLNGKPIFLRASAIVPPGGGETRNLNPDLAHDPESVRKYLRYLKTQNINMVRAQDPLWQSICDEVGMMVFVGRYGVPAIKGATRYEVPTFNQDAVTYYKQLFAQDFMNHPSVMIWILTNEMPKPGIEIGDQWLAFLRQCYEALAKWDPTRAYIATTGFGLGQTGDVNSIHAYLGWYNGLAQSAYKFREDYRPLIGLSAPKQPVFFTETLGAYVDGMGRMPATDKQVAASLMWVGNDVDVPEEAKGYQAYLAKELIEIIRRIRSKNPDLAGFAPFTTSATGWSTAKSVEDIEFLPLINKAYPVAYQPVLLSFDNRWPHVYAGDTVRMPVHLVNDAEDGRALTKPVLTWRLVDKASGKEVSTGTLPFAATVDYYGTDAKELVIEIPKQLKAGQYTLKGEIVENGKTVSVNETEFQVEPRGAAAPKFARHVNLYDPLRESTAMLEKAGLVEGKDFHLTATPFAAMKKRDALTGQQLQETLAHEQLGGDLAAPSDTLLIIGSKQWLEPLRDDYLLMREFIERGGRILVLYPNSMALNSLGINGEIMVSDNEWIGDRTSVNLESLWHTSRIFGAWINPRRSDTGIFNNIERKQLTLWSDPSGWTLDQEGLPTNEPVNTLLKLQDPKALESTAILANFGRGLEYVALAEVFRGDGSVILSGFDFQRFVGFDPIADKVLRNLITYAADSQQHTLVPQAKESVKMGSPSDEDGLVPCEFRNGLLMEYTDGYQVRRIAGPFWFNRLCHTKLINPENKIREAFLYIRPPKGKTSVIFDIQRIKTRENRGKFNPEEVTVSIGDKKVEKVIEGENTVEVRVPLPEYGDKPLRIDFAGTSDMGISQMRFE